MIIKQIKSHGGRSKTERITRLTNYISGRNTDNRTGSTEHKIDYCGGQGFICDSFLARQAEMIALANDAPRSTNPVTHWVLSWKVGERPNSDQMEQAVDILLDRLDLKTHQAIYVSHKNTDNYHLHIAVNRVHPLTEKVVKGNGGYGFDLAHKAIAEIEKLQGWMPEEQRRYQVVDGEIKRVNNRQPFKEVEPREQKIEIHQGLKSAERIAIESGAVLMRQSNTWAELHDNLARSGMRLERYGKSGGYLYVGDVKLKASSAGKDCGFPHLVKRLGDFEDPAKTLKVEKQEPKLLDNLSADCRSYFEAKLNYKNLVASSIVPVKARHKEEMQNLATTQKIRREKLLSGSWTGRGKLLNAIRVIVGEEHQQERSQLKLRQSVEMSQVKSKFSPFPNFEEWTENLAAKTLEPYHERSQGLPNSMLDELVLEIERLRSLRATKIVEAELQGLDIFETKLDESTNVSQSTQSVKPILKDLAYQIEAIGKKILEELQSSEFTGRDYQVKSDGNRLTIARLENQEVILQIKDQTIEINNLTNLDVERFNLVLQKMDRKQKEPEMER